MSSKVDDNLTNRTYAKGTSSVDFLHNMQYVYKQTYCKFERLYDYTKPY